MDGICCWFTRWIYPENGDSCRGILKEFLNRGFRIYRKGNRTLMLLVTRSSLMLARIGHSFAARQGISPVRGRASSGVARRSVETPSIPKMALPAVMEFRKNSFSLFSRGCPCARSLMRSGSPPLFHFLGPGAPELRLATGHTRAIRFPAGRAMKSLASSLKLRANAPEGRSKIPTINCTTP
jgi:hypothetical protein